jgi:hypothetical protein
MNISEKPIGFMKPEDICDLQHGHRWSATPIYKTSVNKGTIPVYLAPHPWNTALNLFLSAKAINELFDERNK